VAVWGQVVQGLDNLDQISRGTPPPRPDKMLRVTVVNPRNDAIQQQEARERAERLRSDEAARRSRLEQEAREAEARRVEAELQERIARARREEEAARKRAAVDTAGQGQLARPIANLVQRALIIGNAAYDGYSRLNNPANDTRAVAAAFRNLGFAEVIEKTDLDKAALEAALKDFGDKAADADWAVVYYSGHGIQVDGQSYIVPTNAKLARASHVEDEAVPLDRVLSKVRDAKKLRLVILDACRDNPFLPRMQQTAGTRNVSRGLARIDPSSGVLVAYSARDGQLAQDGTGQNSPFTEALLEHLEEPGLEIGLLFRKVRDSVLRKTKNVQEPFVYGSIPSEEIFFKPKAN
jgi:hypothetical protein